MRKTTVLLIILLLGLLTPLAAEGYLNLNPPPKPLISVIKPVSGSSYSGVVPLNFSIQTEGRFANPEGQNTAEWGIKQLSYSIDGCSNVTINGNVTLTDLASGKHTIRVFVQRWVYYGLYWGEDYDFIASDSIIFYVTNSPTPTPSSTPTNSPSYTPTPLTVNSGYFRTIEELLLPAVLLIGFLFVVIIMLVYFKKRKN
jgi:hypothetical protein